MYNTGMQFEVPQFIEMEDKIFGPLSWRQFVYLGGGIAFSGTLFLTTHWLIFILIGLPIGLLSVALAFIPINGRPFSFFLEAVYNYFKRAKLYRWKQEQPPVYKQSFAPRIIGSNQEPVPTKKQFDLESIRLKETTNTTPDIINQL
jgi:hypothetical protein